MSLAACSSSSNQNPVLFPAGSWRRTLKATPLAALTDQVATPFPWSETELRRLGVNATFVGHPLLDLVKASESSGAVANRWGIDQERPVVGLLPGSRAQEIEQLLPVQLAAASIIHRRVPGVQFLLGLAPTVDRETVIRFVERERRERNTRIAADSQKAGGRAREQRRIGFGSHSGRRRERARGSGAPSG